MQMKNFKTYLHLLLLAILLRYSPSFKLNVKASIQSSYFKQNLNSKAILQELR